MYQDLKVRNWHLEKYQRFVSLGSSKARVQGITACDSFINPETFVPFYLHVIFSVRRCNYYSRENFILLIKKFNVAGVTYSYTVFISHDTALKN